MNQAHNALYSAHNKLMFMIVNNVVGNCFVSKAQWIMGFLTQDHNRIDNRMHVYTHCGYITEKRT